MKILNSIHPIFDCNGHFYLQYNDQVYELSIDNKNNLELFKIYNNDNFQYQIKEESEENFSNKRSIDLLAKSNTLKSKIIREYIKEKEDDPDIEYKSDDEMNADDACDLNDINSKLQYFPEDLEYVDNQEDSDDIDNHELKFNFYGSIQIKKLIDIDLTEINESNIKYVVEKENLPDLSNYDTFLYNGDNEHAELVFITKLNNINSSYRLFAFKDGSISLKIVGSIKKNYQIKIDKENIILEKI